MKPISSNTCRALLPLLAAAGTLGLSRMPASAAADSAPASSVQAGVDALSEYRLAQEDVISVVVVNFPNLSVTQATLPPDGRLVVPLLDPVDVTGKTIAEVAQMLAQKWRKYVINPSVTVSLVQKRRQNVMVYGSVLRPGNLEYRAPLRTLEALAQGGGPLASGDLSQVTVTRRSGEKVTVDLSRPETRGGTDADLVLGPGDTIYVPERQMQFSVVGEVARPGSYAYKDDMTVLDALTQVGGIRPETADLTTVTLVHKGRERRIDLEAILKRGDLEDNVRLAPGDSLLVPEARNRTYVFGAVARPGYYLFKEGDRVLDALNACGGPLREASLGDVTLVHVDKTRNSVTTEKMDVGRFLTRGEGQHNAVLAAGDVLFVRDKRTESRPNILMGILQALSIVRVGTLISEGR